jgi:hypothetical protein
MGLTLEEANRILRGTLAKAQELNKFPQGGCRMRRDRYQAWASVTARPVAITGDGINHFG